MTVWTAWIPQEGDRTQVFERFTDRARRIVVLSQEGARRLNHNYIGTEHLVLAMALEGVGGERGVAAKVLEGFGIDGGYVEARIEEIVGRGQQAPVGHIPFTPRAKKVLELSLREALQLGHNYIGTEHILLGLIREGEGVGVQIIGMAPEMVEQATKTDKPSFVLLRWAVMNTLSGTRAPETTGWGYGPEIGEVPSREHLSEEFRLIRGVTDFAARLQEHIENRAQIIAEAETAWLAETAALGVHEAREHAMNQQLIDLHTLATNISINLGAVLSDFVHLRDGLAGLIPVDPSESGTVSVDQLPTMSLGDVSGNVEEGGSS